MGPAFASRRKFGNTEKVLAVALVLSGIGFGVLLVVTHRGFDALSGARAYVEGEAHWSKAQKDAVYHLLRYALLEEDHRYDRFMAELDVIYGDRQARQELESEDPDPDRVRQGFLRGRNHPEDIDRLARFFRQYRDVSYVARAVEAWSEADGVVDELVGVAEEVRAARRAGASPEDLEPLLAEVDELNRHLTVLEARFSEELGNGARWAQAFLLRLVVGTGAGLVLLTGALGWTLTRRLRRAEHEVRASEERYRNLYENCPFGIFRTDGHHRIVEANPTLVAMLGYAREEELLGEDAEGWLPEGFLPPAGTVERAGATAATREAWEAEWTRRDGSTIVVSITGRALGAGTGRLAGHEIYVADATEEKTLERQLREAQKFEALGRLSGGIAQDFNNLLTVVLSSASLARRGVAAEDPDKVLQNLDRVEDAARRKAEIVERLVAYARRSPLRIQSVNLAALVAEVWPEVAEPLPSSIETHLHLDESASPVTADPEALKQIVTNLVANAGDAMAHGGELNVAVGARELAFSGGRAPADHAVVLRMEDTGPGLSEEVLERAFEPFFSTKGSHAGLGLGLPVVHGLVHQLGGTVTLGNREDGGAAVEVALSPAEARQTAGREL